MEALVEGDEDGTRRAVRVRWHWSCGARCKAAEIKPKPKSGLLNWTATSGRNLEQWLKLYCETWYLQVSEHQLGKI